MKKDDLNNDLNDFSNNNTSSAPLNVKNNVLSYVEKELNPSKASVFLKLITVQFIVGILTMVFCPQYKLSFTHNYDLFHYFHHTFGAQVCMIICGSIFVGSGAMIAAQILNMNEIKVIRTNKPLFYIAISSIFASAFTFISTDTYLTLVPFWLLGSSLSGILLFEGSVRIRRILTA